MMVIEFWNQFRVKGKSETFLRFFSGLLNTVSLSKKKHKPNPSQDQDQDQHSSDDDRCDHVWPLVLRVRVSAGTWQASEVDPVFICEPRLINEINLLGKIQTLIQRQCEVLEESERTTSIEGELSEDGYGLTAAQSFLWW